MVFSRGLVISLGVSALSATLLFLYFRNRMTSVERKVDLMFDLIQSHETDRQQAVQQMRMQQNMAPSSQNTDNWSNQDSTTERELIDVSDDEEDEYDSEDSREVSDNEEDLEERIKLVTTDIDLVEAEEQKDVVVLEAVDNEPITVDETVELQEVTNDLENNGSSADVENTVQSADKSDEDDDVDDSLEEDSDEDNDDNDDDLVETPQEVVEEVEYHKLKVAELKAIAQAKGLTNYKSLKKQPLIDLIKASE